MPKYSKTFIDNVEKQLRSRDMNKAGLAKALGVAHPNITQLLRKETNPKLDMLERTADALDCEPWDLIRPQTDEPDKPQLSEVPKPKQVLLSEILGMDDSEVERLGPTIRALIDSDRRFNRKKDGKKVDQG